MQMKMKTVALQRLLLLLLLLAVIGSRIVSLSLCLLNRNDC